MSGFSGIETNNKLDKLKLELEREMLKIVYDSYKNGYEKGALKNAPRAMENLPVAPVPCVNGMAGKTVKDFLQKFDEEVDEWKQEVFSVASLDDEMSDVKELLTGYDADELDTEKMRRIAEEAADICTVLASFMEAAGIGFTIRNEAQAHVNRHNHERGRN